MRLLMANVSDHAIITTDPQGHILEWNAGAENIFGYSPDEIIGQNAAVLFSAEDQAQGVPERELKKAEANGQALDERWHVRKGGEKFYASGVMTALRDPHGELRGFAKICRDLTRETLAQNAVRESQQLLETVADSLPAFIAYLGRDLRYRFNNLNCEAWFGIPRGQLAGTRMDEVMGKQAMDVLYGDVEAVLRGERVHFRRVIPLRARMREIEGDYVPVSNAQGEVEAFAVLMTDITERAKEERRREFLFEASTTLAASLDYEASLKLVTRMAVPSLGDWCMVDFVKDDGTVHRLAVAHTDPAKESLTTELLRDYPIRLGEATDTGIAQVLRTGKPLLASDVTDEMLQAVARDPGHLDLLRQIHIRSYLSVPLLVRGEAIGALTFASGDTDRIRYDEDDQRFAEELARRIASVMENTLLYRSMAKENAQRREAEARLINAHEEVLRASNAKSAFLSSMSHELRTPLNAIIGYTELLQEELEEGGERRMSEDLAKIQNSGRHLLMLINDILDLSKIETGRVSLQWEEVEVEAEVQEAVFLVAALAERNNNRTEVLCHGEMGTIRADVTRLRQIFFNLLSNAVKFTHDGVITIGCGRSFDSAGVEWIEVRFTDTGVGIAPEDIGRLFRSFQQLDAGKRQGGTGLGLAISRLLARAMGGDVMVESEAGNGSTFKVRLPAKGRDGQAARTGE